MTYQLVVRVTPRAASDRIVAITDEGEVRVRVTAPPADGAANAAVTRLLARALRIPLRDVVLQTGVSARVKRFTVSLEPSEVRKRLEMAAAAQSDR